MTKDNSTGKDKEFYSKGKEMFDNIEVIPTERKGKHVTEKDTIEANRRLLFAAARGARLRIFEYETRIHPDDTHLAYGPISTALREMAEHARAENQPSWEQGLSNFAANEFTQYFDSRQGEPDYPLFYLILAEFLADEGL